MLVLISVVGTLYCLDKCRVDPRRNFLVDFSCLYFPVSLTTLVVTWAIFYVLVLLRRPWLAFLVVAFDRPPVLLSNLASASCGNRGDVLRGRGADHRARRLNPERNKFRRRAAPRVLCFPPKHAVPQGEQ